MMLKGIHLKIGVRNKEDLESFLAFIEQRYILVSKSRLIPNEGAEGFHSFVDLLPKETIKVMERNE